MGLEENKSVVRRQFELIEQGAWDRLDEIHTTDFANHALTGVQVGLEPLKKILRGIHETFPDETTTIDDVVAEGDRVVVRATVRGTHRGTGLPMFAGIDPRGTPVVWEFIHIFRLEDGKIAEHWAQRNDMSVRRQLEGN